MVLLHTLRSIVVLIPVSLITLFMTVYAVQNNPVIVPENQVDTFVNDLIRQRIVPNALGDLKQYSSKKCIECFVDHILAEKREFWVKLGLKTPDRSWILRLPQQVNNGIRFEYWLATRQHVDPNVLQPIEGLNCQELKKLSQAGLIPPFTDENSYQDIARLWITKYLKPSFLTKWLLYTKDHTQIADWLRVLPTDLQVAVKRYFRCAMLAASKNDVWLGGDATLEVPVSYLIEKKIIPLPASLATLNSVIDLEKNNPDELAQRYAEFLYSIKDNDVQARTIVAQLSNNFKRVVMRKFCEIPGNSTPTKKIFDIVLQPLGEALGNEDRMSALAQVIVDQKNESGYTLNLSDHGITAIEANGFAQLARIIHDKKNEAVLEVLDLSHNKLTILPRKAFKKLSKLRVLDLSYNNLEQLDPDLFQHTPELEKIILRGNKIQRLSKRQFAKLGKLRVLDLSDNQLLPDDLPYMGDLNLEELYLSNNKLTQFSNIFSRSADSEDLLDIKAIAIAKKLKVLDLSNNQLSFNGASSNEFSVALPVLKALEYLDLSGNSIKFLNDIVACELLELKHLLINNNNDLKYGNAHDNRFVVLPKLQSLQAKNCNIKTLHDWKFSSFPEIKCLMLQHNEIIELNGALEPLKKLRDLYLQGNKINKIERKDFASLKELQTLHLEGNNIREFQKHLFHGLNLKEVWLFANNPQFTFEKKNDFLKAQETVVHESAFSGMEKLKYLDLSYNMIAKVPDTLVNGDRNLIWLSLAYNKIAEFPSLVLSGLNSLKIVDLSCNRMTKISSDALYGPVNHLDIYFYGNAAFGFHKFSSDLELSKKIFARYLSLFPMNSYFFGNGATIHTRLTDQFPIAYRGFRMSMQTLLLIATLTYYSPFAYVMMAGWGLKTTYKFILSRIQNPKIEVFDRKMVACDVDTQLQSYKWYGGIENYYNQYRKALRERYIDRKIQKVEQKLL